VVHIWSRNTLKCSPNETFELHCVVIASFPICNSIWSLVGYRGGKRIFLIRVRIQILVPVASSLYWASAPDGS